MIVFYLSAPDNAITKEDYAELEKELKAAGADVSALEYVRKTREISRMSVPGALGGSTTPNVGSQPAGELFRGFSALGNKVSGDIKKFNVIGLNMSFPAYRSTKRRWLGESDLWREKLPADEQIVAGDTPYGSSHGSVLSVNAIAARDR